MQSCVQKVFSAGQDCRLMLLHLAVSLPALPHRFAFLSLPPTAPSSHPSLLFSFSLLLWPLLTVCSGGQWHHLERAALVRCCTHGCWLCHWAGFQSGLRRAEGEVWVALSVGNPEKTLKQRCCCFGGCGGCSVLIKGRDGGRRARRWSLRCEQNSSVRRWLLSCFKSLTPLWNVL